MTCNRYREIEESLRTGKMADWERFASEIPDFPNGHDHSLDDYAGCGIGPEWTQGRKWIINAIDYGSFAAVEWMLSKNVELRFVDGEGYSVLHACIDRESPDRYRIMQLLIDSGADPNIGSEPGEMALEGWTPMHLAAYRNDLEAIAILLRNGADATVKTVIDRCCDAEQTARQAGNLEAAELIRIHSKSNKI